MHPLTIIFSFVIIGMIVAMIGGNLIHRRKIAYKERKDALDREAAGGGNSATVETVAKLEDRVRVLERLATDRGVSLADQIESLRDDSPVLCGHRNNLEELRQ